MNRLTHERNNGIKTGYWSPVKKEELVRALAAYEDTGVTPQEIYSLKAGSSLKLLGKQRIHVEQFSEHTDRIDYVKEFKQIFLDATDPKYRNIGGNFLVLRMHHLERIAQLVKEMQFQIDERQI